MGIVSSQPDHREHDDHLTTIPATPAEDRRQADQQEYSPTLLPARTSVVIPETPLTKAERKARRAAKRERKNCRRTLKASRDCAQQSLAWEEIRSAVEKKEDLKIFPATPPPRGALLDTTPNIKTPAIMQSSFAIDPNLEEAEGTVHTAPARTPSDADNQRDGSRAPTAQMHASFDDGHNIHKIKPLLQAATLASAQVEKHNSGHDSEYVPAQQSDHMGTPAFADGEQGNQGKTKKKPAKRGRKKKGQQDQAQANTGPADDVDSVLGAEASATEGQEPDAQAKPQAKPKKRCRKRAKAEQADGEIADDADGSAAKRPRMSDEAGDGNQSSNDKDPEPRAGPLTKHEWSKVEAVLEDFKKRHDIDQRAVNDHIQSTSRQQTDATKELWSELYDSLGHRHKVAVMRACRRRYNNYQARGKWTAEEDEDLRQAYAANEGKWVKIGSLLERMPEDCRDRWRNYLACEGTRKIDDWNEREELELQQAVYECADSIKEAARRKAKEEGTAFRDQDWLTMVHFSEVSKKLGKTRSRLQCYTHWRVMQRRPENQKIRGSTRKSEGDSNRRGRALANFRRMLPGDKYQILSMIANKNAQRADEIPWKQIHRENPNHRWTTRDRKETFAKLKSELTPDEPHLPTSIESMLRYFEQTFPGQLEEVSPPEDEKRPAEDEEDEDGDLPYYDGETRYLPDVSQFPAADTAADSLYSDQAAVAQMRGPAAVTTSPTVVRKPKKTKKPREPKARGPPKKSSKKSKDIITQADEEAAQGPISEDSEDERRKLATSATANRPNGTSLADHLLAATSLPNPYQATQVEPREGEDVDIDTIQQQATSAANEMQEDDNVETAGYPEHLAAALESDAEEPVEDTPIKVRKSKKSKTGGKKKGKSKSKA